MARFDPPGFADQLSEPLLERWQEAIQQAYKSNSNLHSRFFALDPTSLTSPVQAPIQWFADPAEPAFCINSGTAQKLSDWGAKGRHQLHNEYCEYSIVVRPDQQGALRPKRVQITTELREYWLALAVHDPTFVRGLAGSILGSQPVWEDLYGVSDPFTLSETQREIAFSTIVAGNGGSVELEQAGVPRHPTGRLNTENALFMSHPINGLDDLFYIVLFGAHPYARRAASGQFERANKELIFRSHEVEQLACRHADPAAAMGAYGAAWDGRCVAFQNPIGMYIRTFASDQFSFQDAAVPSEWITLSRGNAPGLHQRLVFGPPDDSPYFLDDIQHLSGSSSEPVTGGFVIAKAIEVGPVVLAGQPSPVAESEYVPLEGCGDPIICRAACVCREIRKFKQEYDHAHPTPTPSSLGLGAPTVTVGRSSSRRGSR
jgi:hypothetical protein